MGKSEVRAVGAAVAAIIALAASLVFPVGLSAPSLMLCHAGFASRS